MNAPLQGLLENIQRIFHITTSPLQSLLVPRLWSSSSDSETTVPSLLMELWDERELPSGSSVNNEQWINPLFHIGTPYLEKC